MNDDLISRQAAIKNCQYRLYESALNNIGYECKADDVFSDIAQNRIQTWLEEVPSAQPEWDEMMVICDCCGHAITVKRVNIEVEHDNKAG